MTAHVRRFLSRHPPAHVNEPTRAVAGLAALAVVALLAGCSGSAPTPSPTVSSPAATPTPTSGPGGYESLSQACTAIADDLITLQTIGGTVEIGLGSDGAEAILAELAEMRELAPVVLRSTYRSVADAIRDLPAPDATAVATPTSEPSPAATTTPGKSPAPEPAVTPPPFRGVIDSAADELTIWLTRHCADL